VTIAEKEMLYNPLYRIPLLHRNVPLLSRFSRNSDDRVCSGIIINAGCGNGSIGSSNACPSRREDVSSSTRSIAGKERHEDGRPITGTGIPSAYEIGAGCSSTTIPTRSEDDSVWCRSTIGNNRNKDRNPTSEATPGHGASWPDKIAAIRAARRHNNAGGTAVQYATRIFCSGPDNIIRSIIARHGNS